jgi:hypothetical protein
MQNERAQELARDGYPDTPDKVMQTLATDSFLKGSFPVLLFGWR